MGEAMIAYGRAEIASFLFETGEVGIEFDAADSGGTGRVIWRAIRATRASAPD